MLTPELHHQVKKFDKKLYICETHHKYLYKKIFHFKFSAKEMALDPIPDEIKDFFKNRRSPDFD